MAKKAKSSQKERLFEEELVPAKSGSGELFEVSFSDDDSGPVECLGMTFDNDQARRDYFLEKLREKLKDPEFRKIEGFPVGEDEDILAMSDPPYYTACPNPFLNDFIDCQQDGEIADYQREPFATDVSEGKSDGLYQAHSYHTKVPHKAIIRFILHYTNPGDIVLDGFSGSGMTGVAAQMCGCADDALREQIEDEWKQSGDEDLPQWGFRKAILTDLSPAATFISANYNLPIDLPSFESASEQLLSQLRNDLGWMYEADTPHSERVGTINYTVWSELFHCPECTGEVVFLEEAFDPVSQKVAKEFPCPHCDSVLTKRNMQRAFETVLDRQLNEAVQTQKRKAVLVNYALGKDRCENHVTSNDEALIARIMIEQPDDWFPTDRMMHAPISEACWGDNWRAGTANFTHLHHIYLARPLKSMARLWALAKATPNARLRSFMLFFVEQSVWGLSILARYAPTHFSQVNQYMSGLIRVLSQHAECSPWYILEGKRTRLLRDMARCRWRGSDCFVSTGTCNAIPVGDSSVDYIFTDPPFGDNLAYSELNFLIEAWHRVFTNASPEAVISRYQNKSLNEYHGLMQTCFAEYFRVLRPGRWMTVVFHNSKNAVWNSIQEAIRRAGFVIADVRTLDKKHGSYNQIVARGAVKQDLIITAYKPRSDVEQHFDEVAGTEDGVWDFVSSHLDQLPAFVVRGGSGEVMAERQDYLLFDRMVAFHVQRGKPVPLSAGEFYSGLFEKYPQRDGMYFLPEQVVEYDKRRMSVEDMLQLELFVSDEVSAIQWIKQVLGKTPQTFSGLQPQFMKEVSGWDKHESPLELTVLLDQNFLCYDGDSEVPSQIHSYLSSNFHELRSRDKSDPKLIAKAKNRWYVPDPRKEGDLEKIRHRSLMKEFDEYRNSKGKLKVVRTEALRAGFKDCWQTDDFQCIVDMSKRLKDEIIQEDPALLMYYDNASMRIAT